MIRSHLVGFGAYLPERVITNAEMTTIVDTSDEWIVERTGIRQRHVAAEGQFTSDLALEAARKALKYAGIPASELDMVIVATATPDNTFPATATKVQAGLGMTGGFAFDIQAVCSGFIYALATADNFIKAGQAKTVMVIGAETFSRILDWNDRATCVLFGDGAGAVLLRAETGKGDVTDRGILSSHLHSDGRHYELLQVNAGPSRGQAVGYIQMEGREGHRLGGAAPGQQAHPRQHGPQAGFSVRAGRGDGRPSCQHFGRLGAAGPGRGDRRRPHQAGRAGSARGDGRRFHLGRGAGPHLEFF
jgi:3-oxoacyl-[acyl-carrier-protein] synthase-3